MTCRQFAVVLWLLAALEVVVALTLDRWWPYVLATFFVVFGVGLWRSAGGNASR